MPERQKLPKALVERINSITNKRARVVLDTLVKMGSISTAELQAAGYDHPPRAARDVVELGIALKRVTIKRRDGPRIASYVFDERELDPLKTGRVVLAKKERESIIERNGSKCGICGCKSNFRTLPDFATQERHAAAARDTLDATATSPDTPDRARPERSRRVSSPAPAQPGLCLPKAQGRKPRPSGRGIRPRGSALPCCRRPSATRGTGSAGPQPRSHLAGLCVGKAHSSFRHRRYPTPMPLTVSEALRIGRSFLNVEESTSWGAPALEVCGNLMACLPTNKAAEPGSFLIRMDCAKRPALLAEAPNLYYAPDHYLGYDGVLVRLAHCTPELMHDLLVMAHRFVCRKPAPKLGKKRRSQSRQ